MSNSMEHFNGDQLAVIDIETTGLDAYWHEIIQIAILPLDSNLKPRKDVLPFYLEMMPSNPERIDEEAMKVNKLKLANVILRGHDPEKVKDLLEEWFFKLKLPLTKYGKSKRLVPLGQNYTFDKDFITHWLGINVYQEYFHHNYRDTMIAANYINDQAAMHAEKIPFSKVNLSWLAKELRVERPVVHDALQDCIITAEVYRCLLQRGLMV